MYKNQKQLETMTHTQVTSYTHRTPTAIQTISTQDLLQPYSGKLQAS